MNIQGFTLLFDFRLSFIFEKTTIMKKSIFIILALSTTLFGCKKKGCTDANAINFDSSAEKDDGSCEYLSQSPVLLTANFDYVDRNEQYSVQARDGRADIGIGAAMFDGDSTLLIHVYDLVADRSIILTLETFNGQLVSPGTYDFSGSTPDYDIVMEVYTGSSSTTLSDGFAGGSGGNVLYHNVLTSQSGQLTITSITNDRIQGTISGDLFGEYNSSTANNSSKLTVTNGQFNTDLVYF